MAKAPSKLDWNALLSREGSAPAPEPEVFAASAGSGGGAEAAQVEGGGPFAELSDLQIQEEIQRLLKFISAGFASKMPDKGTMLRENIRQLQGELDRREIVRLQKDAGEFYGRKFIRGEEAAKEEVGPFAEKLSDKGVNFWENLRQSPHELDRRKFVRFQKDAGECEKVRQSRPTESSGGNVSSHSPKRKRASENRDPMNSRSKKGGHDGAEETQEEGGMFTELSDQQIHEKIQQSLKLIATGMANQLPDKGVVLQDYLRQLQGELDRRERVRSQKDAEERQRARQFTATESSEKPLSQMAQTDRKSLSPIRGRGERAQRRAVGGGGCSRDDERDAPSPSSGEDSVVRYCDRLYDMIQGVRTELREFQAATERSFTEMRQLMMRGFGFRDLSRPPEV